LLARETLRHRPILQCPMNIRRLAGVDRSYPGNQTSLTFTTHSRQPVFGTAPAMMKACRISFVSVSPARSSRHPISSQRIFDSYADMAKANPLSGGCQGVACQLGDCTQNCTPSQGHLV
jgi:hypothetical protein